jgi:uncharacterized protein
MSGFLADLIEKCLERAAVVVTLVLLLAASGLVAAWYLLKVADTTLGILPQAGAALAERQQFESRFTNLENMMTMRLTGENPEEVAAVRKEILQTLATRNDIFKQMFSPGHGSYYETYAFLYQDTAKIKQRLDYFRDLRPLLDAVSQSRNLASIATLTESVAAAANEGRNPQVFVDVYRAIATTVEAAFNGKSAPIDWTTISGLGEMPAQRQALILAWPNPGKTAEALTILTQVQEEKSSSRANISLLAAPGEEPVAPKSETDWRRLGAAAAIAAILSLLSLFVLSRSPAYAIAVFVSWIITLCIWLGCLSAFRVIAAGEVPPLLAGAGFALLLLAHSGNAIMLTANARRPRGIDTVDILGRDAARRIVVPVVMLAAFLGCTVYVNAALSRIVLAMGILYFLTTAIAVTVLPVIWQFVRDHKFDRGFQPARHGDARVPILLAVGAIAICSQAVLLPLSFKSSTTPATPPPFLSVLEPSEQDARDMVDKLRSVPEVKGARWIGGFLPEDAEGKNQLILSLDPNLPEPGVVDTVADPPQKKIEDAKKLEAALTSVSLAGGADETMRAAALSARRSLTAVIETGSQTLLPQIERDLFSGLASLSERLRTLASLRMPSIGELDPAVIAMFVAPDGTHRIEVEPADGVSSNGLAFALVSRGILPVSRAVELRDAQFQFQRAVYVLFGIGALACFMLLVLARVDHTAALITGLVTAISMAATILMMLITRSSFSEQNLVLALAVFGCMWGQAAMTPMSELFRLRKGTGRRPVDFVHWLMPLACGAAALSLWLVGSETLAFPALAITAVLLQTACLQATVAAALK